MPVGRSSGIDEPSGHFGNQAVFGPLSTTQLVRSCGNELEKVCRSAGRTFKPFLYGAMHAGNDYKDRSIGFASDCNNLVQKQPVGEP